MELNLHCDVHVTYTSPPENKHINYIRRLGRQTRSVPRDRIDPDVAIKAYVGMVVQIIDIRCKLGVT